MKEHEFYASIHWDQLMMHKAEFIPYLDSDEDTSYFDGMLCVRCVCVVCALCVRCVCVVCAS